MKTYGAITSRWGGRHGIPRFFAVFMLLFLMAVFAFPALAQEATQEAEATPTVEVVATVVHTAEAQVEDAPVSEPTDVHNWFDDLIEFATENHLVVFLLVGFVVGITQINRPQTRQEYESNKAAIERQKADAVKTETPYDDWLAKANEMLNEMRRISEGVVLPLPNPSVPPTFPPAAPPTVTPPTVISPVATKPPLWIPINPNPNLNEVGANGRAYFDDDRDGRAIAVPTRYIYRGVASTGSPHCEIYYKQGDGFEMALAQKAGRFGFESVVTNFVLAGNQRFAVVVKYSAKFTPVIGSDGNPTVYLGGALKSNGLPISTLPHQPVVDGEGEAQWVFQTAEEYHSLSVEVAAIMLWAVVHDNSTLLWKEFKVVPVADDYGDDVLIRI